MKAMGRLSGSLVGGLFGFFCFLSVAAGLEPAAKPHKVEYPQIVAVSGAIEVKQKGEPVKPPLVKKVLKEQIFIETAGDGKIEIALSGDEILRVSPRSQVLIPAIDWETGNFEEIQVLQGSVYLRLHHPLQVRNDLYRDTLGADQSSGEFVLGYYPEIPQVGLMVLEGQIAFRGLENEEKSLLGAGESQVFVGERQDGQVQYDVLLEGRKVARGQLRKKEGMTKALIEQVRQSFQVTNQAVTGKKPKVKSIQSKTGVAHQPAHQTTPRLVRQSVPQSVRKTVKTETFICKKPLGRFNDCAYECVGNAKGAKVCNVGVGKVSCVRRRCLAQGEWGDELIMATQFAQCEGKVTIRPCDY